MFTEEEKKTLLQLLNSVQVTGNRQTIGAVLEKLDQLIRKIEAMPIEAVIEKGGLTHEEIEIVQKALTQK